MQKLLYLVSKPESVSSVLIPAASGDREVSVVLIQDGVSVKDVPGARVFVLSEDAETRRVSSALPLVSYRDLLTLMFEADTVIVL